MTMPRHRRRLSEIQRTYWEGFRFDILALEGFTPEEAGIIMSVRISSGPIRRIRRQRKRKVIRLMQLYGISRREAVEQVRSEYRGTEDEIIDFDTFRRVVYGDKGTVI